MKLTRIKLLLSLHPQIATISVQIHDLTPYSNIPNITDWAKSREHFFSDAEAIIECQI